MFGCGLPDIVPIIERPMVQAQGNIFTLSSNAGNDNNFRSYGLILFYKHYADDLRTTFDSEIATINSNIQINWQNTALSLGFRMATLALSANEDNSENIDTQLLFSSNPDRLPTLSLSKAGPWTVKLFLDFSNGQSEITHLDDNELSNPIQIRRRFLDPASNSEKAEYLLFSDKADAYKKEAPDLNTTIVESQFIRLGFFVAVVANHRSGYIYSEPTLLGGTDNSYYKIRD
jgi:hypothetical protein